MPELPRIYGLGSFEQVLVGRVNEAVFCLLDGIPEDQQPIIMDQVIEGETSGEVH